VRAKVALVEAPAATVNLLPPAVLQTLTIRRLRTRFLLAAVGLLALLAAAWLVQGARAAAVGQEVAAEQDRAAALGADMRALAPIREFSAAVTRKQQAATVVMSTEVSFSELMRELAVTTPAGVKVETLSVTVTVSPTRPDPAPGKPPGTAAAAGGTAPGGSTPGGSTPGGTGVPGASGCRGPDPFVVRRTAGCVTLAGSATTREAVGRLVVGLGASDVFVDPFVSTVNTGDDGRVTFMGTVGLSEKVFSPRFTDPTRTGSNRTGSNRTGGAR
jgi:hypothetical protein